MCNHTRSEKNAAASAAGSQLAQAAANINPFVDLAVAIARPLVRLFGRHRSPSVPGRTTHPETGRPAAPDLRVAPGAGVLKGSKKDPKTIQEGSPRPSVRPPARRSPPRIRARVTASVTAEGGLNHG